MAKKMKNYVLISLCIFVTGCNYSSLTCSESKFAESLKSCSLYKCEKPFIGVSYVVKPLNNSMCKVDIGFYKDKQFMSCQGKVKEFAIPQAIISNWSKEKKEKQAQYNFETLEIEYLIEGKSIGKPFNNLVSENKCNYAKRP